MIECMLSGVQSSVPSKKKICYSDFSLSDVKYPLNENVTKAPKRKTRFPSGTRKRGARAGKRQKGNPKGKVYES